MTGRRKRKPQSRFQPIENDPPTPEFMPDFSLDRWITEGRREMGEERWAELNAEWEDDTPGAAMEGN